MFVDFIDFTLIGVVFILIGVVFEIFVGGLIIEIRLFVLNVSKFDEALFFCSGDVNFFVLIKFLQFKK